MEAVNIKKDLYWIGSKDSELRVFDVIMNTKYGTTYNSYLLKTDSGVVLLETVKVKFFEEYLEKLKSIIDLKEIKYIVVNHTEPDHVGSVEKLLEYIPDVKVIGTKVAIKFLKKIVNKEFEYIEVVDRQELTIGEKTLEFLSVPFLHWPDSMYTYIKELNTLVTCDSFGAHYCFDGILYSQVKNQEDYFEAFKYYYNMIMGPFKSHVRFALEKIQNLPIDMICVGHGPIIDIEIEKFKNLYSELSIEVNPNARKTVVIPYVSAYGYTEMIGKKIVEGIESLNFADVRIYDMVNSDKNKVLEEIKWADGVIFGSTTINGDVLPPIWELLISLSPLVHNKKLAASFGSYGWSGEAVGNMDARLKSLRMKIYDQGLKINFKPTTKELEVAFEYGVGYGKVLMEM